ncbi:MAG TPA: tetratricopeptide repeat protein, partial [Sphingomonas sp.]|nr:tetratricopeptide repeat protein [Sphingomonas sp.]
MPRQIFILLVWLTAGSAAAATPKADAFWRQGDYRNAFAQAFEPATHGDAHAQYLLGEAYRLGRSVDPNFPLAQDWYARAARQGNIAAATELGLLYARQRLDREALPWLSLAALRGEPRALASLAALYFNGTGVERDPVLAVALMSRAAAAGLAEAKLRLITLRAALPPPVQSQGMALAAGGWADALRPAADQSRPRAPAVRTASVRTTAPKAIDVTPFHVQIGAYWTQAAAERAWALLGERLVGTKQAEHIVMRADPVYRLHAQFAGFETARNFCRRLEQ